MLLVINDHCWPPLLLSRLQNGNYIIGKSSSVATQYLEKPIYTPHVSPKPMYTTYTWLPDIPHPMEDLASCIVHVGLPRLLLSLSLLLHWEDVIIVIMVIDLQQGFHFLWPCLRSFFFSPPHLISNCIHLSKRDNGRQILRIFIMCMILSQVLREMRSLPRLPCAEVAYNPVRLVILSHTQRVC